MRNKNFLILIGCLCTIMIACGGPKPEAAPDIQNITEAPLAGSFYLVAYQGGFTKTFITHKLVGGALGDTDWTQNCSVPLSDFNTVAAVIECYVEAHELDLYAKGLTLSVAIPPQLCDYFEEDPYYFFKYLPGVGPAGPLTFSSTNPTCSFDYTAQKGPNCCSGRWSMNAGADPATQPARSGSYGGDFANCYSGPNIANILKSEDGIPISKLYSDSISGIKISKKFDGLFDFPNGGYVRSNMRTANYFLPTDHSHVSNNPQTVGNAPIAFDYQLDTTRGAIYPTNPFYNYTCYDSNKEVRARIRLSVREWNTINELHQGGNPNLTGPSTIGDENNDYKDWKDLGDLGANLFPGSSE